MPSSGVRTPRVVGPVGQRSRPARTPRDVALGRVVERNPRVGGEAQGIVERSGEAAPAEPGGRPVSVIALSASRASMIWAAQHQRAGVSAPVQYGPHAAAI